MVTPCLVANQREQPVCAPLEMGRHRQRKEIRCGVSVAASASKAFQAGAKAAPERGKPEGYVQMRIGKSDDK
jgi:hypothetical protein